jgi:hypothetical protein
MIVVLLAFAAGITGVGISEILFKIEERNK